jgi:hypothetical protein
MFADKQLTPGPASVFVARITKFCAWLATPPPIIVDDASADWYTGLVVDPRGFSDQLGKLQTSLRQAGPSVSSNPARK